MEEIKQQKLLSSLCHLSVFSSSFLPVISIGIPIAILIMSDDLIVKKNAKEAINYQANYYFWIAIFGIMMIIYFWLGISGFSLASLGMETAKFSPPSEIWFYLFIGLGFLLAILGMISFSLMILLLLMACILPIIAIIVIANNPGKHYRYPFIIRFIR